ncbi:MAG: sulfur oxidation c-type cytochrome SoxX [Rhodobacteraceae bacterium]|jgi:sulfur-oxidizing protein SoxX|nr:sulfur oxidation c-type cytochrome SoxX [Paracoccaceae bacterium]MBT5474434.1 sulfur oxidation c-type cytochrome SoxX [Paracoccaceae bacterium]MBT5854784.1 sulfur oxidation c-type cytochrome SoxX [Paracoccaceae bacterium]MBT6896858.1 sulfur oxidation c-type cytochrome SoxX [Paracoccaceae bacterium]
MGRFSLTLVCLFAGSSAFAGDVMPANVVFNDGAIGVTLTTQAGDPAAGRKVFMNRKQGNCLACHANEDMSDQSFHGEVGPALDGVADRWEAAELRGIVVNSKMMFEGTIMPAFYKDGGFERNLKKFQGKSILNAQQVEDVVAYLLTLKEE